MKIEDHGIKPAARKMTGEATPEELQMLNDLFEKDAPLYEALEFLFSERTADEQQADDHDRSQLLFEKIKAKINNETLVKLYSGSFFENNLSEYHISLSRRIRNGENDSNIINLLKMLTNIKLKYVPTSGKILKT